MALPVISGYRTGCLWDIAVPLAASSELREATEHCVLSQSMRNKVDGLGLNLLHRRLVLGSKHSFFVDEGF